LQHRFFPLSPTRTLCVCDPAEYAPLPEVFSTDDEQTVMFQNHLLIHYSTRYLIANTSDFAFAKQVLADQPQFADPQRLRLKAD
jgi:hypothetical protein